MLNGAQRVTILISHFLGDSVELCDGLVSCEAFAGHVPIDHDGVIDLCMCEPMPLVHHIKRVAPGASVCFASARLTPALWFLFYAHLFRLLKTGDWNYVDAMERTCFSFSQLGARS